MQLGIQHAESATRLRAAGIRVVEDRVPISLGRFTVTPIESRHFQFPDARVRERALGDPEIREPLVPPVGTFEYKVGKAYALHVSHPRGSWLIQGSAGRHQHACHLQPAPRGGVVQGSPAV